MDRQNFQPQKQEISLSTNKGNASLLGTMVNQVKSRNDQAGVTAPSSNAQTHQFNVQRSLFKQKVKGVNGPVGPVADIIAAPNAGGARHSIKPAPGFESITSSLTLNLLQVYLQCNPEYSYQPVFNPRRALTKPSKPMHNDGADNENWDFILYVNDIIGSQEGQQYQIMDLLGQGTFGQVVKCQNIKTKELFAIKVIKNKPAYYNQSLVEVAILDALNKSHDPDDKHHLVRMKLHFVFKSHLCIGFEMLSVNLYELIKQNQFRGLSTNLVRIFVTQILDALSVLQKSRIIHCDLKPENILLKSLESPAIKVIDFGSACNENQTVYTYIQSRFYRSPEVILGLPYSSSIDMWSLGCIASEIFLGLPLFPGTSEYNQIARITSILGVPPTYMCSKGKASGQFFNKYVEPGIDKATYSLKPIGQYMKETGKSEQPSKKYFKGTTLSEIIQSYPVMRKGLSSRDLEKEMEQRRSLLDFLTGILNINPVARWSPEQARKHPFITGEKFVSPYIPKCAPTTSSSPTMIATLKNGEVREIRGARPRGISTINLSVPSSASPTQQRPSKAKGPALGISIPDTLMKDAPQSAFLGSDITRVAGSFADFQLRNHNSFNNNPPLSAAVLNTNTNAFDYGPSVYTRRGSITQGVKGMYQNMPTRKPWEGDPYSLDMQGNIDESFAEHPRYGDFGERQRIPSRLPSAAASVDWEPFHDDAGYGRNSRQPSNMDMNPSSPKSLYQQRNSFHNRSFSHSSSSFLNDDNMRKSSQSLQGGDHQGNSQPEFVGRGSLSRLNTSDIAMHDHEQGHPMSPNYNHMGGGSPSRSSFPISPRSSQSNLFGQPYYKHQNNKRQSNTSKPPEEDDQGSYRRASSLLATNITYSDTMKTPEEATAAMNLNSAPIESDTAKEWHMPIDKPKEGDHSDS